MLRWWWWWWCGGGCVKCAVSASPLLHSAVCPKPPAPRHHQQQQQLSRSRRRRRRGGGGGGQEERDEKEERDERDERRRRRRAGGGEEGDGNGPFKPRRCVGCWLSAASTEPAASLYLFSPRFHCLHHDHTCVMNKIIMTTLMIVIIVSVFVACAAGAPSDLEEQRSERWRRMTALTNDAASVYTVDSRSDFEFYVLTWPRNYSILVLYDAKPHLQPQMK